MQIIADVTGYPVLTIKEEIEAPLGGCFLAAKASGILKDGIQKWFSLVQRATPDVKNHEHYSQMFNVYRQIYLDMKFNMHKLHDIANN